MNLKIKKLLDRHNNEFKIRRNFNPSFERIINVVKEDTDISKKAIYQIVAAQFLMLKDTMMTSTEQEGLKDLTFEKYKSMRFIYLGAFVPSKNKFKKLIKKIKEYNNV